MVWFWGIVMHFVEALSVYQSDGHVGMLFHLGRFAQCIDDLLTITEGIAPLIRRPLLSRDMQNFHRLGSAKHDISVIKNPQAPITVKNVL